MLSRKDRLERSARLLSFSRGTKPLEGALRRNGVISLVDPTSTLIPTKEAASTHVCGRVVRPKERERGIHGATSTCKW